MHVSIATIVLGVEVPDITSVLAYGCSAGGLMYSHLSGHSGQKAQLQCVCQLLYD